MDIVYICGPDVGEELRYSIRSVEQNLTYDNLWVIGYKPDWYLGNYIEFRNKSSKFNNIRECLAAIPQIGAISEEFVYMEDDFFLMKPMGRIQNYYNGSLKDFNEMLYKLNPRSPYTKLMHKTYKLLVQEGIPEPLNYELHVPIIMNKSSLANTISLPGMPKSVYGNLMDLGGKQMQDVKVYSTGPWLPRSYDYENNDEPFLSTIDESFKYKIKPRLEKMFPNPSRYEL